MTTVMTYKVNGSFGNMNGIGNDTVGGDDCKKMRIGMR